MTLLKNEQYTRLMATWREHGTSSVTQAERIGRAIADCAMRVRDDSVANPIVVVVGNGEKGAAGLAAVSHLHDAGIPVQLVLETGGAALSEAAAFHYERLQEKGLRAWGLSLSDEEMAEQDPIDWMHLPLIIDTLLEPTITEDPHGNAVDVIRMVNSTRRPILSLHIPSGVGSDEGYIYSPCLRATHTLCVGVPLISVAEAWMVAGNVWVADVGIPSEMWDSIGEVPPTFISGASLVELGSAKIL